MKEEITSLDLHFLVKELNKILVGGVIQKIYQYGSRENYQFLFEIYNKQNYWLYLDKNKIFLTEFKKSAPQTPPSFCMFLRKHLMGSKITDISQYKFDRIIEIKTEKSNQSNFLIIELFSKGNVILTDSSHNIIMPLEIQRWKDRTIKPKNPYKYPPSNLDPFSTDLSTFKRAVQQEKTISSILAVSFGFGKEYAYEICAEAKIDGNKLGASLKLEEIINLSEVLKKIDRLHIRPTVYTDFISLFPMQTFVNRKPLKENIPSISKALDEHFSKKEIKTLSDESKKVQEEKEKKIQRIINQQKKAEVIIEEKKIATKSKADLIYANYPLVSSVLNTIKKLLKMGKKWPEIKIAVEREDTPETAAIKEIRENDGIIVVNLAGESVELDINKSVEENAGKYYEDSKKLKRKLENVKAAIENVAELEKKFQSKTEQETPQIKERKKWYEKFKWFISSSGFLVIAGRDATQNENIVKKHAEHEDFLLHADIPGASFVLIKSQGKPVDGISMKEAAEFSAANSKAWSKGIGNVDVYAFRPEQATKPEGSLPKGSFVIQGQRIWFKDMPLKQSVGIKIDREKNIAKINSGPVMAVRKNSDYFITIQPGHRDSFEISREIKTKFLLKCRPEDRYFIDRLQISDIQIHIPSGRGEIVE